MTGSTLEAANKIDYKPLIAQADGRIIKSFNFYFFDSRRKKKYFHGNFRYQCENFGGFEWHPSGQAYPAGRKTGRKTSSTKCRPSY